MPKKNMTQSIEDYLETIYEKDDEGKGVRITTLSEELSVAKSSVNQAIKKLKSMGLVEHEAYGRIYLTDSGRKFASEILDNHRLISSFLTDILQVPKEIAESDACKMEHFLSNETLEAFKRYVKK
jgi:DtxR family Mn-dependent transcriptional regulator